MRYSGEPHLSIFDTGYGLKTGIGICLFLGMVQKYSVRPYLKMGIYYHSTRDLSPIIFRPPPVSISLASLVDTLELAKLIRCSEAGKKDGVDFSF